MSAYMCGVEHWSILAERISRYDPRPASQLFDILAQTNKDSIDYRYAEGLKHDPDYMYDHTDPFEGGYRVPADLLWSREEYVMIVSGYDYQSCEHPGYPTSEGYKLIRDLLERLSGTRIDDYLNLSVQASRDRCTKAREDAHLGGIWNPSESSVSLATWEDAQAAIAEEAAKAGVKL